MRATDDSQAGSEPIQRLVSPLLQYGTHVLEGVGQARHLQQVVPVVAAEGGLHGTVQRKRDEGFVHERQKCKSVQELTIRLIGTAAAVAFLT